jgi:hypothetical protein
MKRRESSGKRGPRIEGNALEKLRRILEKYFGEGVTDEEAREFGEAWLRKKRKKG